MRKCGVRGILGMIANLKHCIAVHPPKKPILIKKKVARKCATPFVLRSLRSNDAGNCSGNHSMPRMMLMIAVTSSTVTSASPFTLALSKLNGLGLLPRM